MSKAKKKVNAKQETKTKKEVGRISSVQKGVQRFFRRRKIKLYFVVYVNEESNTLEVVATSQNFILEETGMVMKFFASVLGEATYCFMRVREFLQRKDAVK